jgi:hypothetical protein
MRRPEDVEHTLGGEIAGYLFPHDVAQFQLRDVGSDPERRRELHHVEPVGDDEHAVDRDLDRDDVVDVGGPARAIG